MRLVDYLSCTDPLVHCLWTACFKESNSVATTAVVPRGDQQQFVKLISNKCCMCHELKLCWVLY